MKLRLLSISIVLTLTAPLVWSQETVSSTANSSTADNLPDGVNPDDPNLFNPDGTIPNSGNLRNEPVGDIERDVVYAPPNSGLCKGKYCDKQLSAHPRSHSEDSPLLPEGGAASSPSSTTRPNTRAK